jgi:HSP20 family protein
MALIRWQPWQEMETLRHQMDQLFDELAPVSRPRLVNYGNRHPWSPAIELINADTELLLRAELPGIAAKDLDIQVTREAIALSGEYKSETKTEENRVVRSEFRYGHFHRVIPLPVAVRNDQVKAEFKDGILTLNLPKLAADRPKVVKINLNGNTTEPVLAAGQNSHAPASTEQVETGDVWAEAAK